MLPWLLSLRRALARALGGGAGSDGEGRAAACSTVPVTVRAHTSDGADMRLLLDVHMESWTLQPRDLERFVHALVVPATRRWVGRHDLGGLEAGLPRVLPDLRGSVGEELSKLGATLVDVEVVAAEHLLTSPSADPVDGPG